MRITLFVGRPDFGGGARVISIYAERLQRRGHEVTVFARPPRKPTVKEALRHRLRGRPLPADTLASASYFDGKDFFRLLDRHRPATAADVPDADVVCATWWETAEWVAGFPPSKGAKAYFVQGYEIFGGETARVEATWRLPMRKIVVAQWLAGLARERFGDPGAALVPNAVELSQFAQPARGKQAVPTVGMVYTPLRFKGCDVAIEAYVRAKRQMPELELLAFGVEPPTAELPLPEGAQFVHRPAQDRIRELYGRCDAWLWGSRQEGFGLPLLEAMASRTPVIATPAGAAPELMAAGGGILVPQEEPDAMASALLRVCGASDADWRRLSDNAYAAASRYTWDDATDLFESALRSAVEAQRPRGSAAA